MMELIYQFVVRFLLELLLVVGLGFCVFQILSILKEIRELQEEIGETPLHDRFAQWVKRTFNSLMRWLRLAR